MADVLNYDTASKGRVRVEAAMKIGYDKNRIHAIEISIRLL